MSSPNEILFAPLYEALLTSPFAESVIYEQVPIAPFVLTVIWFEQTGQPITALGRLIDFPLLDSGERSVPRKGDNITRLGHIYRVVGDPAAAKDGAGGVTLELRKIGDAA